MAPVKSKMAYGNKTPCHAAAGAVFSCNVFKKARAWNIKIEAR